MPITPGPEDVPQVALRNTADVVPIPQSATIVARARSADAMGEATGRIAEQQNEIALATADADATTALEEVRVRMLTDNDWQTQPHRAAAEASELYRQHGEKLRGAATRRAWRLRATQRISDFRGSMLTQSRERGGDLARADLIALQTRSLEMAGDLSQAEHVRRTWATNYIGAVQRAEEAGLVAPDWASANLATFAEALKGRVQDGLRGEFIDRLQLDPHELADELEDPNGPFHVMPADERARMGRQARQQAAAFTIDDVLEETLRTGQVVGEDDARLAAGWAHLGDGARLQYAERASNAIAIHRRAAVLGDLDGLSMTEILARADENTADADTRWGAGVHVQAMRADPAAYVRRQNPNLDALRARASQAIAAAQEHPDDSDARLAAVRARQAYVTSSLEAQLALGLPSTRVMMHDRSQLLDWARRVRRHTAAEQNALLEALPAQMLRMYGDEDLADRAVEEHREAYYAAPSGLTAPAPDPTEAAAQGATYEDVRTRIVRALNAGSDLDDPVVNTMVRQLPLADRSRLMADPQIRTAGGLE